MKCADSSCRKRATRTLHGIPMCEDYYIEAIEHSAHIVTVLHQPYVVKEIQIEKARLEKSSAAYYAWKDSLKNNPEATQPK